MKKLYFLIYLISWSSFSQTPTIDNTFAASYNSSYEQYIGNYCAPAPDGKLWAIRYVTHDDPGKIIRVNVDGLIDPTFAPVIAPSANKIYSRIDGSFIILAYINSTVVLYSFSSQGIMDTSFVSPTFTSGTTNTTQFIKKLIFQSDGKIIFVGNFYEINGIARGQIVRLNTNGSVDTSFLGSGFGGGYVNCLKLYNNDKIAVGGDFTFCNGIPKYRLSLLNSDGSTDESFNVNTSYNVFGIINGFYEEIREIGVQSDGKIIALGSRLYANSNPVTQYAVRLNANGTRDTSFSGSASIGYRDITVFSDGKIFDGFQRYNSNGTNDTTFGSSVGIQQVSYQSYFIFNNKIYYNSHYNSATTGKTRLYMFRRNLDGSFDSTFNPNFGFNSLYYEKAASPPNYTTIPSSKLKHKVFSDGKIIILGNFSTYNDQFVKRITRLTYDGELDTTFSLDASVMVTSDPSLHQYINFEEQNDGKIIVMNSYSSQNYIKRLNVDGSLDNTFSIDQSITKLTPLYDGKFLTFGTGSNYTQSPNTKKILRLNANGTIDTSFNCPFYSAYDSSLLKFKVLSDNKIIIARESSYNNTTIARVNSDGSIDNTFQYPINNSGITFYDIFELPDGKYLLYYSPGSTSQQPRIRRLNADGSIDTSFTEIVTYSFTPRFILNSGHIIFYNTNQEATSFGATGLTISDEVLITTSNGTIFTTFADKNGFISLQDCNKIIFTGGFLQINGHMANCLTRYNLSVFDPVAPPTGLSIQTFNNGQTLSNLNLTGSNITWYDSQNVCLLPPSNRNVIVNVTNSVLPNNTPLVSGVTYFASQTVNGIESFYRLPILATQQLSINENEFNNSIIFYPNPVNNLLNVKSSFEINKFEIISILGDVLESKISRSNEELINFSEYSSGIYFIKVHSENSIKTIKIIKN